MAEINFPALRAMAEEALPTGRFGCNPAVILALLDRVEKAEEQAHYANGTCDLAMKHRDLAERDLERLLRALGSVFDAQDRFEADVPNHEPDPVTTAIRTARTIAREIENAREIEEAIGHE